MEINFSEIEKILIIAPFRFGDVLLNTGYLPFLREKFPTAKIDFLTRIPCQMMLEGNPNLDGFVLFRKRRGLANFWERVKLFWRVRKRRYDLIIDQTRGTTGGQITLFSGAKYRLGYANSRYKRFYNFFGFEGKQRYSGAMRFDLLESLGIKEQKFNLHFTVKDDDRKYIKNWFETNKLLGKKLIVLSPGSPVPRKMWELDKYAKLCDLIVKKLGYVPILRWIPEELKYVKKVQALAKEEVVLAPPADFSKTGALLENSVILVCNDGGINHFSQAVGCPSLAIFTDSSETKNWSMQGVFERHWHITAEKTNELTVEKIFAKLQSCLQEIKK